MGSKWISYHSPITNQGFHRWHNAVFPYFEEVAVSSYGLEKLHDNRTMWICGDPGLHKCQQNLAMGGKRIFGVVNLPFFLFRHRRC